jgi:DNA-binding response OmpR family regulator
MKVLVADDDLTTCTLVATILRRAGHEPILAQDATQAMLLIKKHLPDLVVLDVQMPGGTGLAVLQNLKSSIRTTHVPVIVLSGVADRDKVQQLLDLGATEYLSKPVDPESLLGALDRAVTNI